MIDAIADAVRKSRLILFVGAGVSRSLGLPSWTELIAELAKQVGFDPAVFATYGGNPELAEYYELQVGSLGKLRSWMDVNWHRDESKVDGSRIHNAIVDLNFPAIYTTNYDRWLEIAFRRRGKPYEKIATVGDFASASDKTHIVKFHGDFEHDDSLVLTERSYFERLAFESPLDIKLRSDSIGRGILFVGYSLTDVNIRYLLYKLHKLWAQPAFAKNRPPSYMVASRPNPVQAQVLNTRGINLYVTPHDDSQHGLTDFLESLLKKIKSP